MPFSPPPPSPVIAQLKQLMPLVGLLLAAPIIVSIFRAAKRRRKPARALQKHKRRTLGGVGVGIESQEISRGGIPSAKVSALARAEAGSFSKKRLFNNSELRIFRFLEQEIAAAGLLRRVMGQTHLRGFLNTDSRFEKGGSHFAIGEMSADFVVTDEEGNVTLVVEYHGEGHFQNDAERRDAKSIAFSKAGIPFLILKAGESEELVRSRIRHEIGAIA